MRTGQGLFQDLAAAHRSLEEQGVRWGDLLGYALLAGFTFGTAFQVCKRHHVRYKSLRLPVRV